MVQAWTSIYIMLVLYHLSPPTDSGTGSSVLLTSFKFSFSCSRSSLLPWLTELFHKGFKCFWSRHFILYSAIPVSQIPYSTLFSYASYTYLWISQHLHHLWYVFPFWDIAIVHYYSRETHLVFPSSELTSKSALPHPSSCFKLSTLTWCIVFIFISCITAWTSCFHLVAAFTSSISENQYWVELLSSHLLLMFTLLTSLHSWAHKSDQHHEVFDKPLPKYCKETYYNQLQCTTSVVLFRVAAFLCKSI